MIAHIKELISKTTFANWFCMYVFTFCMGFFFYVIHRAFMHPEIELPNEADQIMIAVIGFSGAVVGYVVGSSASSKSKDDTINKAMDSKPTNP